MSGPYQTAPHRCPADASSAVSAASSIDSWRQLIGWKMALLLGWTAAVCDRPGQLASLQRDETATGKHQSGQPLGLVPATSASRADESGSDELTAVARASIRWRRTSPPATERSRCQTARAVCCWPTSRTS